MRLQQITNTGSTPLYVPYALAIYNPSYALIAGQAWNWGASGSANNGTFSGPVTMVRIPDTPVNLSAVIVSSHGCSLGAPTALSYSLSGLQADHVRVLRCLENSPGMIVFPPV